MFQRPQQLMTGFAKEGHEAHFINKAVLLPGSRSPKNKEKINNLPLFIYPEKTEPKNINFDTLYYSFPPPGIREIRRKRPEFILFDSVDEPTEGTFSFWNADNAYYESLEVADLVLATADILYRRAKQYNDNVLLVPNGCDYDFFSRPHRNSPYKTDKPIVLYSGAIASWVDLDLIKESAREYPDYHFVCIGGAMNDNFFDIPENLEVLGHKDYEDVPRYIQHANACIIPFKANQPEIKACNPIKLWEYLATGKPVVTTAIPETKVYGVYWSTSRLQFINNIGRAVREKNLFKIRKRKQFAKKNSWENRVKTILNEIEVVKNENSVSPNR
jgi:glycosyltransferase involved in cell wall biosynthesis